MSVVAVRVYDDRIEIAADSICTNGENTMINDADKKCSKLFRYKDMVIGCVGCSEEKDLLELYMKNNELTEFTKESLIEYLIGSMKWMNDIPGNDGDLHNRYIFASKGKCLSSSFLHVFDIDDYYAIGAGDDFARGALYMGATPEEAVRAACHMCVYAIEPIQVESVYKENVTSFKRKRKRAR